jgi:serine/threonine protein kinase
MLTSNLPYESPNARALLRAKTNEEPRPPSYYVPGFDPSLEAIIMKAIEVSPRDRYATAAALLADLKNPSAVLPRDPAIGATRRRAGARVRRRFVLSVVVAAVLATLASLIWLSARDAPRPVQPQATPRGG